TVFYWLNPEITSQIPAQYCQSNLQCSASFCITTSPLSTSHGDSVTCLSFSCFPPASLSLSSLVSYQIICLYHVLCSFYVLIVLYTNLSCHVSMVFLYKCVCFFLCCSCSL